MAVQAKPDQSDEVLMTLYQAGEYEAFEILYRRHSPRVFEFFKRKTNAVEIAGELLQETFLKVHRSRAQYSAQYPFLPWLFTVARNVFLDSLRRSESKVESRSYGEGVSELASPELASEPALDMGLALQDLPESQRRAIELRYLSDWSFEQIAAEMKTSPLNARQLISRGIKKLRAKFAGGQK